MKITANKNLFWFLKEGAELDLSNQKELDLYIEQALTRGKISDVRTMLKTVGFLDFTKSLTRIKHFLPKEVQKFWEETIGNINQSTKTNT